MSGPLIGFTKLVELHFRLLRSRSGPSCGSMCNEWPVYLMDQCDERAFDLTGPLLLIDFISDQ